MLEVELTPLPGAPIFFEETVLTVLEVARLLGPACFLLAGAFLGAMLRSVWSLGVKAW